MQPDGATAPQTLSGYNCITIKTFTIMDRHDNESLLGKYVLHMTGEELVAIFRMAATEEKDVTGTSVETVKYVYGVQDLAAYIGCCASTIYDLKRQGVLKPAIVSKVGKKIVFNAPLARQLADEYQRQRRQEGGEQ